MQLIVSVYPCDYQGDLVITAMGKSPLARGSAEVSNLEEACHVIETVARPFRKTVNAQIYWRASVPCPDPYCEEPLCAFAESAKDLLARIAKRKEVQNAS